jgi:SAM-dependent methyltransferase
MTDGLTVPDAAVKYVLFQRTAYLRLKSASLYRLLARVVPIPTRLHRLVVAVESRLGASEIKALYADDMTREFASIRDALPTACSAVLDIGCGVAGIDALIHRHYEGQPIDYFLLDKTHVDRTIHFGFRPRGSFYNSLGVARSVLAANGISPDRIHLLEAADDNSIRIERRIDVVLSLLSWGFHYPVAAYLDRVDQLLGAGGVVILDVRRGTDGVAVLNERFGRVEVLVAAAKYERVVVRKAGDGGAPGREEGQAPSRWRARAESGSGAG